MSTRPRRPVVAVAVAVAVLVLLAGCGGDGRVRPGSGAVAAGYVEGAGVVTVLDAADRVAAPDFSGPTLDGGTFALADHRGSVVVLNVWGSWCPPCRKEASGLAAVAGTTAASGVRFVGVNTRDTVDGARAYVREFGIGYPSVVDTDGARLLAFAQTLPPAAIPSTLVIDRAGRMAARVLGPISETSLRDLVEGIAAERA